MLLAMAAGIIIARKLGPELRGYFGLIFFSTNLLFSFGHLGIGTSITYFSGKNKYPRTQILAFLIASSIIIGGILTVAFYLIYPKIPGKWSDINKDIMIMGLLATPFIFLQDFISRFLLSMLKVRQRNITNLMRTSIYLVLIIILLIIIKGKLLAAVLSYTLSTTISSLSALVIFTRDIKPDFRIKKDLIRDIFRYGFKAYLIDVLNFMNFRLDILLIQHFLSISQLSFYQMAVNISERLWYIPQSLSITLFPTLLSQEESKSALTEKVCRHNLLIMLLISIPIALFGKFAINLLYGNAYLPAAPALYALLLGIVIYPIFKFISVDLAAKNKLGISILASLIGVAINLFANLILIPKYGIVGAGIATSISYSAMAIILIVIYARLSGIPFKNLFLIQKEDLKDYKEALQKIRKKLADKFLVR